MAQLTDGVRLAGVRAVRAGASILLRMPAAPAGVAGVVRGVRGLRVGPGARRSGVVPLARSAVALRSAATVRRVPASVGVVPVSWRFGGAARRGLAVAAPWSARRLVIAAGARAVAVSPWRVMAGPGQSAGEISYALPAAWSAWEMPAGYIGEIGAVVALVRGESWAMSDEAVTIGGRVLVDQHGAAVVMDDVSAAKWVDRQLLTAEKMLGAVWMAPGPARDAALSDMRDASWSDVRKRVKSLGAVSDAAVRAALVADLILFEVVV